MQVFASCPHCAHAEAIHETALGRVLRCSNCEQQFQVSSQPAAAAPPRLYPWILGSGAVLAVIAITAAAFLTGRLTAPDTSAQEAELARKDLSLSRREASITDAEKQTKTTLDKIKETLALAQSEQAALAATRNGLKAIAEKELERERAKLAKILESDRQQLQAKFDALSTKTIAERTKYERDRERFRQDLDSEKAKAREAARREFNDAWSKLTADREQLTADQKKLRAAQADLADQTNRLMVERAELQRQFNKFKDKQ